MALSSTMWCTFLSMMLTALLSCHQQVILMRHILLKLFHNSLHKAML
ncbi:hypothetical protein [Deltalipothrixvirus pozzuoliense]|uniref:Uncharacterized protein ORF46 n=1 Tax=Acidianus filamentous virus 2 (isolate Italy/Pozzuoli) TaxID=654910 RepID=Y046_AFV2P|nr:hypothetical protein AFV2_gp25 [Acidianus filamentous virus 2]Q573E4.1 RecName: Full=Uncharacterized protein ORF46 [Acidianus filamentous virus 2 (isolate Pozzuoli)]CAH69412.1 hypothetical protein [Acidianus filamentous virus 2]